MNVIQPITITQAMLVTDVAEPSAGETAWVSGTTYAVGDVRIRTTTHRRYERLVAGAGTTPPESDTVNWLDVGPTNAWAMLDLERSSQTEVSGGAIQVAITPGRRFNAVGLVGLYGASVTVEVKVGAATTYGPVTANLLARNTTTWSQYFFGPFRVRGSYLNTALPLASGATVYITIQPTDGVARCGGVVLGGTEDLGVIVDEPVSDVVNFSKVTRDEFGNATLTKRRNVPVLQHRVHAPAARLDRLRQLRDDLDAVPALWSGVDARQESPFFDTLLVLGVVKKWSISMTSPLTVMSDLQLEEI